LGGAAWLEGRWRDAARWQEKADERIRRECTGAAWQLATINIVMFDSLYRLGDWERLFERLDDVQGDAEARGDLFLEIYLRIKFRALFHLAAGDPDAAQRELDAAIDRWSKGSFTLLHFWHIYASAEVDLYRGASEVAEKRLDDAWGDIKKSLLLTLSLYRISIWDLRGRIELARVGAETSRSARHAHLRKARSAARTLRKEKTPWADAVAAMIEAGAHASARETGPAFSRLNEAAHSARGSHMNLHAHFSELRRAEMSDGTGARDELARSRAAIEAQRIQNVSAWANVLSPGFGPGGPESAA
jgi:hypothetical protein